MEATRHLLRFAERVPSVRRYVYRSYSEVYARTNDLPALLDEFHPLRMGPKTPAWILDRVEADLAVCARHIAFNGCSRSHGHDSRARS